MMSNHSALKKIPLYCCLLFAVCCLLTIGHCHAADTITGTFPAVEGYDIATVRYVYTQDGAEDYGFASITGSAEEGYSYSFTAPTGDFTAVEGTSLAPVDGATVIAQYYSLTKWDGAVDVSWYNETDTDFYIGNPAELAGVAAIVNGSINGTTPDYMVKGDRASPDDRSVNRGLPDCIECTYYESTDLIAGVKGCAYKGVMAHDFANRTIHLTADLDMGGVDGSEIVMGDYDISTDQADSNWNRNLYDYPNWTPIGGEYLMDVTDSDSMIISFFNGTIDGGGHNITNLYCYRWSYRTVGETAYGYSQGVGLVGDMGTLYDDDRGTEENPTVLPAIRNLGLSGFIYGRRMVGGFVGCIGGGSNAADGSTVAGGICLENLANHAYVYCTDSKGLGGIVGCSMSAGSIVNCYNDGLLHANYAAPTGGIVGSNEGMDVFCCYNRGSVYAYQNRGRGIGCDNAGRDYTVDNCYYLENCGNDSVYPGYYTYNLADSVSVNVTELSDAQLRSDTLLSGLNTNGTAYVMGESGYPVLWWEANGTASTGTLTLDQPQGGTITAAQTGTLTAGTVVYLTNTAQTGWNFRYYTLNGVPMTGDYVTVSGDCTVSAYYESAQAGVLNITPDAVCSITVTKNGIIMQDGTAVSVTNYPVASGDPIYEGDLLIVTAAIRDGQVPEDPGMSYAAAVGIANPFEFTYSYTGGSSVTTDAVTYTVTSEILGEDVSLTLTTEALTTPKLWKHQGDTSWYSDSQTEFTLTTPEQLAGLASLVEDGTSFAGKTVLLGADISMANNDGSGGKRWWDGIGTANAPFAGTFDGQGHSITDLSGSKNGLFTYCTGTSDQHAVIRNVTLYGEMSGQNACGITAYAKYAEIENCSTYCSITGSTNNSHSGGIIGYAQAEVSVTGCSSYGTITATGKVGGIAGEIAATASATGCISKCDLNCLSTNGSSVGGVVGSLSGRLTRCASYGTITAWGRNLGGIAGQSVSSSAVMTDCYNVGDLTLENNSNQYDCIGGIIGFASYYKVSSCYNYGTVTCTGTTGMVGGVFGREGAKSTSTTSNVYYLDSSCSYAENNTAFADLPDLVYCSGIHMADAAAFAAADGVLSAINSDSSFVLTNGTWPELATAAQTHVHTGGTATCSTQAVCSVCGLSYGALDPNTHEDTVLRNAAEAVWTTDGYTGDLCCRSCGAVITPGEAIPADTARNVLTVNVVQDGETILTKTYTAAQFDALKTTSPYLVYSYGTKSDEIMVTTEYVTISDLMDALGGSMSQLQSLEVICAGSHSTLTAQDLTDYSWYYNADGNASAAPAALCIAYTNLAASPDVAALDSKQSDSLRFGYGISKQQYDEGASVGGKRLVSPVTTLNLYVTGSSIHTCVMAEKDGVCQHVCTICGKAEETVTDAAVAPTCTGTGLTAGSHYAVCGTIITAQKTVPAAGHSWDAGKVTTPATCTAAGVRTFTCTACGETYTESIPAAGHSWDAGIVTPATCIASGYTTYTCRSCGETRRDSYTPLTDHSWDAGKVTAPTCTERGYTTYTCGVCGKTKTDNYTPAAGHSWGSWTVVTGSTATTYGTRSHTCSVCQAKETSTLPYYCPFQDISSGSAYYYIPILWAADAKTGITNGTSKTTFAPNLSCTRGQVVTFLWRAAGKPEPKKTTCSFTDVQSSAYYYKAILWAVEQGITNGTSKTTFSPDATVTRGQFVTFLWRAAGKPAPTKTTCSFTDVNSSMYYYNAVLWAVEQGITNGASSTTFAPESACTRGQVVTFIYRYYAALTPGI